MLTFRWLYRAASIDVHSSFSIHLSHIPSHKIIKMTNPLPSALKSIILNRLNRDENTSVAIIIMITIKCIWLKSIRENIPVSIATLKTVKTVNNRSKRWVFSTIQASFKFLPDLPDTFHILPNVNLGISLSHSLSLTHWLCWHAYCSRWAASASRCYWTHRHSKNGIDIRTPCVSAQNGLAYFGALALSCRRVACRMWSILQYSSTRVCRIVERHSLLAVRLADCSLSLSTNRPL